MGVLPEDQAYQDSLPARVRGQLGVTVTPAEVVDFQVRSAVALCEQQAADPWEQNWIDPSCGAGIYPERLIRLVPDDRLERFVAERLWANDIIERAARWCKARIERRVSERTGRPFDWGFNVSWVDTLEQVDLPWERHPRLGWHAPPPPPAGVLNL